MGFFSKELGRNVDAHKFYSGCKRDRQIGG